MTPPDRRLLLAFFLSLVLHAAPGLPGMLPDSKATRAATQPPPLTARLVTPPPAPPPPLILPEPTPPAPAPERRAPPPKPSAKPAAPAHWNAVVRKQLRQHPLYSQEAIDQRLEGDPVVLFVLDTDGNVSGARIEQSSGHPLLDRDALRAVRGLRALPADAPREVVLPLRFRLKD